MAELFGEIKVKQYENVFNLKGDWAGKSPNHWCNGTIQESTNYE